jgi:hypothetical protein
MYINGGGKKAQFCAFCPPILSFLSLSQFADLRRRMSIEPQAKSYLCFGSVDRRGVVIVSLTALSCTKRKYDLIINTITA